MTFFSMYGYEFRKKYNYSVYFYNQDDNQKIT